MAKQYTKANAKPACEEFKGRKSVTRFIVNPRTKWIPEHKMTFWNFAAEETGAFISE